MGKLFDRTELIQHKPRALQRKQLLNFEIKISITKKKMDQITHYRQL